MKAVWVVGGYPEERGGTGQIKERKVRERKFGTSSRTKSNFAPTAKLSYFLRNMHARGRAEVFQQRVPASYRRHSTFSHEGDPFLRIETGASVYIHEMADKIPIVVTHRSRAIFLRNFAAAVLASVGKRSFIWVCSVLLCIPTVISRARTESCICKLYTTI